MSEALQQLVAPRVGTVWEGQGGIYVGVMTGENGAPNYHLIASADEGIELEWGPYGKLIEGADSTRDGIANTKALLASKHAHPAAKWAAEYTKDGHSDFYLPAQRELNLCYATVAEQFSKNWCWSSTQFSANYAWGQGFGGGSQYGASKDYSYRARAVRRITI